MMKQVIILHGGNSFSSYDNFLKDLTTRSVDYDRLRPKKRWRTWLAEELTSDDILLPDFPNSQNAQFKEWEIYFEKLLPFFGDDVRLVGHSLGAMFLAKYLQTKPLNKKVKQLILIAPGYNDNQSEDLGSFEVASATDLPKSAEEIHLFHSQDDPVVPFSEFAKFKTDLPTAHFHEFTNRGHFIDATFPELLELLKS